VNVKAVSAGRADDDVAEDERRDDGTQHRGKVFTHVRGEKGRSAATEQ
jgi:hypothetical protein